MAKYWLNIDKNVTFQAFFGDVSAKCRRKSQIFLVFWVFGVRLYLSSFHVPYSRMGLTCQPASLADPITAAMYSTFSTYDTAVSCIIVLLEILEPYKRGCLCFASASAEA